MAKTTLDCRARHIRARRSPGAKEAPITDLLDALTDYATQYEMRYEGKIGNDYVLGPIWAQIGLAIHGLLNGETGDLDCGALEAELNSLFKDNGLDFYEEKEK